MNDDAQKYEEVQSSAFMNFMMEAVNYVALIVSVILTFSLSMLLDLLTSTCNLARTGICFFLNRKLQKNLKFSYNYGADRLESLCAVFCDFLLALGSVIILGFAVYQLFFPREVSGLIIVAVVFKVVCVLADIWVLVLAYRAYRKTQTKVARTVFEGTISASAFDIGILFAVFLSMALRSWPGVGYVEPIISIVIAAVTVLRAVKRIRTGVNELSDLTLDEQSQMKILKTVNAHFDEYSGFRGINSHRFGSRIFIDLDLDFSAETTFDDVKRLVGRISEELKAEFPDSSVSLRITGEE
ncbi:MAG: cation transporter [Clostridia bacterium]|nr:cation transporter [Clostridia bacterium]